MTKDGFRDGGGGGEAAAGENTGERGEGGEKRAVKVGSVLSECDMNEVRSGQRMFGDCEVAKWEGTGRTERRSAADLSTQTAALPLSARPQADKEPCAYSQVTGSKVLPFPSIRLKNNPRSITKLSNRLATDRIGYFWKVTFS